MTTWNVIIADPDSPGLATAVFSLRSAAHAVDQPDAPQPERPAADAFAPSPATAVRMVLGPDGSVLGMLTMSLPQKDNRHRATMQIITHPAVRRQGIGRALAVEASLIATQHNRDAVMAIVHTTWEGGPPRPSAGAAFAESLGFEIANTEIRSRASTEGLATEDTLLEVALAASSDYETIRWTGCEPEETLDEVATLHSTFNAEAPMGQLRLQASPVSAEQLRETGESAAASGTFRCGVVARHRPTGAVVGNTFIVVRPDSPDSPGSPDVHGDQLITLVSPDHRGHRLSMRLKIENLRQLRERRPDVAWVWTENAETNAAMRRVNEQLGFEPVDYAHRYQHTGPWSMA